MGAAAFDVLADMLNSIVEVAAVQEDYRVVLAALELACAISCQPGKLASSCYAGLAQQLSYLLYDHLWVRERQYMQST